MTQVSLAAMQAMFAPETEQVFLACLTISHPDMATPIRVVNDKQDLVRSAGTFIGYPFDAPLPNSQDDQLPQVQIRIDNVDPTILNQLRALDRDDDITVTLEIVMASSPDTVEAGPFDFTLKDTSFDVASITGTLAYEDILNEVFPKDTFTPTNAPGLF